MIRTLRYLLITLVVLLLLLAAALYWLVPVVVEHYARDYLQQQGADLQVQEISLHPFRSEVVLRGIKIRRDNRTPFSLANLELQVRIPPLLDHQVQVSRLLIEGLDLAIRQQGDRWEVAGVDLPPANDVNTPENDTSAPTSDSGTATETGTETDTDTSPHWTILLPDLSIRDSQLRLAQSKEEHTLVIRNLSLNQGEVDWPNAQAQVSFDGDVDQASLTFKLQLLQQDEELQAALDLTAGRLALQDFAAYLPKEMQGSHGKLDLSAQVELTYSSGDVDLNLDGGLIQFPDGEVLFSPYRVGSHDLRLVIPQLKLAMTDNQLSLLELTHRLQTGAIHVFLRDEHTLLASWEQFEGNEGKFRLTPQPDTPTLDFVLNWPQFSFSKLVFSQVRGADENLPALLTLGKLTLSDLETTAGKTVLGTLAIQDVESNLILSKEHQPMNLVQFDSASPEPAATESGQPPSAQETPPSPATQDVNAQAETAPDTQAPGYGFQLKRFDISGENRIMLTDQSVKPAFERAFIVDSFHLDDIDTEQPDQASPFELKGSTDRYSKYQAEGSIKLFKPLLNLNLTSSVKEVALPPLSPYVKESLGYEFESGLLDLDLSATITDGKLKGKSKLVMRGVDLTATNQAEASTTQEATTIPLNVAFGMLKDSNGNVELEAPLSGDVNNPSFGIQGFLSLVLQKAILQGATHYLAQAFVPYASVVTVVQLAGEQALKMRFEPLELAPGQVPGEANAEYLRQFAALLKKKDSLQVKICGVATVADLQLPQPPKELSSTQEDQLRALALQRAESFKSWMVEQGQIASSRLLLCNAGIDKEPDAKPRLDFET